MVMDEVIFRTNNCMLMIMCSRMVFCQVSSVEILTRSFVKHIG